MKAGTVIGKCVERNGPAISVSIIMDNPTKPSPPENAFRCDAFAEVSNHVAGLLDRAAEEGKVVAIPARA